MDSVLDILGDENLERIWLERTKDVIEGQRKIIKSVFDIHVGRSGVDRVNYEDTINHLSESTKSRGWYSHSLAISCIRYMRRGHSCYLTR